MGREASRRLCGRWAGKHVRRPMLVRRERSEARGAARGEARGAARRGARARLLEAAADLVLEARGEELVDAREVLLVEGRLRARAPSLQQRA